MTACDVGFFVSFDSRQQTAAGTKQQSRRTKANNGCSAGQCTQQHVTDTDEASQRTEQKRLYPVSGLGHDNTVQVR